MQSADAYITVTAPTIIGNRSTLQYGYNVPGVCHLSIAWQHQHARLRRRPVLNAA